MDLLYYRCAEGNFGDDLNPWFWDTVLPGWRDRAPDTTLVGIGTLLNAGRVPDRAGAHYLVLGSGVGYGGGRLPVLRGKARWDIRGVRGPISARKLGLSEDKILTDPAVIVPDLHRAESGTSKETIFVPHHTSVHTHDWDEICARAGIGYCSPSAPFASVFDRISRSSLVLAEAMHAAILADAFRVPWIPVSISPRFNAEKWQDWAGSVGLDIEISPLAPQYQRVVNFARSPKGILRRRLARLLPNRQAATPDPRVMAEDPGRRPLAALQRRVERDLLVRAMAARVEARPFLSEDRALERAKARFYEGLDGIRRDYGFA